MSDEPIVDTTGTEIVQSTTLVPGHSPAQILENASEIASALTDLISQKNLYVAIRGKHHVTVEGWTALGALMGVTPVVVWTRPLEEPGDWEARVEARTMDGRVVGAAEAECRQAEGGTWGPKASSNARRAMAQTRATSRALRGPLGFIVSLAGYQAVSPEEMPETLVHNTPPPPPVRPLPDRSLDLYTDLAAIARTERGKQAVKDELMLVGTQDLTNLRAAVATLSLDQETHMKEWAKTNMELAKK